VDLDARLTVLGSLNMDISVSVPSLPSPGETVLGGAAAFAPGGKGANQAVAAARLGRGAGVAVRMVGCVGDDDFGRALRSALTAEGVDDQAVRTVPGVPTGIAMITVDQAGENIITVAPGANRDVGPAEVAATGEKPAVAGQAVPTSAASHTAASHTAVGHTAVGHSASGQSTASHTVTGQGVTGQAASGQAASGQAASGQAVAGQTAAAGPAGVLVISAEIPVPAILAALTATGDGQPAGPRPLTVLNLAPAPPEAVRLVAAGPDWLVVNESEAAAVLGRPVAGLEAAAQAAADLVAAGAGHAVVTAGAAGAAYQCGRGSRGEGHEGHEGHGGDVGGTVPAFKVRAVDSVGAGDTFVGALAVALAAGLAPRDAVTAAAAAGAAAAARPGTQAGMPRPADIRTVTGYDWPIPPPTGP